MLLITLNKILYLPLLKNMDLRRNRLDNEKKAYQDAQTETSSILGKILDRIKEARKSSEQQMMELVKQTEQETKTLIGLKTEESKRQIDDLKNSVKKQTIKIKGQIEPEISQISQMILKKLLLGFILVFLIFSPVYSSGQNDTKHEEAQETENGGVSEVARTIDFVLMVGLLMYFLKKPVSQFFSQRSRFVETSLIESAKNVQRSTLGVQQSKDRFQNIQAEIDPILTNASIQSETMKNQLIQNREKRITRLEADKERQQNELIAKTKEELTSHVVNKAIEQLKQDLSAGIDKKTDQRLIDDFLNFIDTVHFSEGSKHA
jgi:F-type H+-transporting ATPase subunit b